MALLSSLALHYWNYLSISNSLAKALAGRNSKLIDTTRAITEDGSIEIVTPDHEDALQSCVTSSMFAQR